MEYFMREELETSVMRSRLLNSFIREASCCNKYDCEGPYRFDNRVMYCLHITFIIGRLH